MKAKPGNTYFLVREAVKAGAVSYKIKRTDLAKLGGKAEVEKLAQGAANITVRENDGVVEIKQTFKPDRIPICIKSAELVLEGGRGGSGTSVALKSANETPMPKIKRVGVN